MKLRKFTWLFLLTIILVLTWLPATIFAAEKPADTVVLDQLPPEPANFDGLRKELNASIEAYLPQMKEMTKWLKDNPESGYNEYKASKMMGGELEKNGFVVKYGVEGLDPQYNQVIQERFKAGGLPTALVAKYKGKTEHPVICFMFEADALRRGDSAFHGCEHNMQGPVALGSAINLAKLMEKHNIPGSVWAVLTPAEEIPPPDKTAMAKAGVFDDVDFLFSSHGHPSDDGVAMRSKGGFGNCCFLIHAMLIDYAGKTSHARLAWNGRDASDGARLFFNAVDMLREHSEPEFRLMGAFTKMNTAPNVVADSAQIDFWIRNGDPAGQEAMDKKAKQLEQIAQGTAQATFTEAKVRHYADYYNGIEYGWLQGLWWKYVNEYGDKEAISEKLGGSKGWAECGYPSVNTPGIMIQPAVAGIKPRAGHTDENCELTITPQGDEGLKQTSMIGTSVALRLLLDEGLRQKVKDEQKQWQAYGVENKLITSDMIRKKQVGLNHAIFLNLFVRPEMVSSEDV